MTISRREFLMRAGALGMLPALQTAATHSALAAGATDYRALVFLFLFGGNDGNNMIVPVGNGYSAYAAVRSTSSIGLAESSLLPLAESSGATRFGLHPKLVNLQKVWTANRLTFLFNVGTLVQPVTKAQVQSGKVALPNNLFSHQDQQDEWQTAVAQGNARTGWGGRIADAMSTAGGSLPTAISLAGSVLYATGATTHALTLQGSSGLALQGFGTDAASLARKAALDAILADASGNTAAVAYRDIVRRSLDASKLVQQIESSSTSAVTPFFTGITTDLANQLQAIAKFIEARATLGAGREVFFCALGGFDTHTDELNQHNAVRRARRVRFGHGRSRCRSTGDLVQRIGFLAHLPSRYRGRHRSRLGQSPLHHGRRGEGRPVLRHLPVPHPGRSGRRRWRGSLDTDHVGRSVRCDAGELVRLADGLDGPGVPEPRQLRRARSGHPGLIRQG